jgi:hypothetical protein
VAWNPFKRPKSMLSPWTPSGLQSIVIADIFGEQGQFPASREDAMQCAPVVKARALLAGTISRLPLKAYKDGMELATQPTFLYRSDSLLSPQQRMLWTVDDLIFTGYSLWAVQRGTANQIMDAIRVPVEEWSFTASGTVEVKGEPVSADEVILFCGPQDGLLDIAGDEIRSYRDLVRTRASRLRNPVSQQVLHPTEELDLQPEEIDELLTEFEKSNRSNSTSISWLPHNVNLEEHGASAVDMFEGQANQLALQFSQKLNVESTLIGAAVEAQGSLNYQNQDGQRSWFVDYNLAYWLDPITSHPQDNTLADATTRFPGLPLTYLSGLFGRPYNSFGMRATVSRRLDLGVRDLVFNHAQGTVNIKLASDEARLMDLSLLQTEPLAPAGATVRAAVEMVLAYIGAVITPGTEDGPIESDAIYWQPGQSAWDYISPLVNSAGLRLYCNENGRWHLTQPLAPVEGALTFNETTMLEFEDQITRNEDWFDSVVVVYKWRDSSNVERTRYDIAREANATSTYTVEYNRPWPGDGAAAAILKRGRGRGRVEAVTAVSNYGATPGQTLLVTTSGRPIQTGLVTRVQWSMGTDTMQVRSRDLIDTPPNAWALVPPGTDWQDIPTGMSWNELDFEVV